MEEVTATRKRAVILQGLRRLWYRLFGSRKPSLDAELAAISEAMNERLAAHAHKFRDIRLEAMSRAAQCRSAQSIDPTPSAEGQGLDETQSKR